MADEEKDAPELEVAKLFQLAGHEVSQAVGAEPGTVDWFATPREGFVRPRTYWRAWKTCPERFDEALAELEEARVARHADRALGVVMEGRLPEGYRAGSEETTRVVSYRRFALEVSGISAHVADRAAKYAARGESEKYLPLRGEIRGGTPKDAELLLKEWVEGGDTDLALWGDFRSQQLAVIDRVAYEIAGEFAKDPERVTPLVRFDQRLADLAEVPVAVTEGFAVPVLWSIADLRLCARGLLYDVEDDDGRRWEGPWLHLLPVTAEEIERWFQNHLSDRETYARMARMRRDVTAFRALSEASPNARRFLGAMQSVSVASDKGDMDWLVQVVAAYMQRTVDGMGGYQELEDGAFEEFALGGPRRHWAGWWGTLDEAGDLQDVVSTWMSVEQGRYATNRLVRDYLIALRLQRELAAGRRDLLARYDFPQEYVLLFLAALSPEAAAQAASGRTAELRAQIETEVERRLQLTLAHALKRSAGAVGSHLRRIQRHLKRTAPGMFDHELARIDEEVAFQCALAEQTRLWHDVPESAVEGLALRDYVESVVADLREAHPQVAYESAVDATLRVRASRDVLREILHCLLENAFQAVAYDGGLADPRVRVEARAEGGTIRLDVLDNGSGVSPSDRDRIFDLYVTTKKGGDKKPLGTGMGLPIARRYAEHVGGQVGLDPEREPTCFFARFVAWRDIG